MAHILEFNVTPVICILGIVLNIINLLVLTERGLKESPYIYLRALSFTDLSALVMTALFLVFTSPPGASGFITSDGTASGDFGVFYGAYFFLPLNSICNNSSTWIVITLTIERFLFVKKPLWARDACTPSGAKVKTVVVMLVISIVNIPRFLYYRVVPDPASSQGLLQLRATEFRYSQANEKVRARTRTCMHARAGRISYCMCRETHACAYVRIYIYIYIHIQTDGHRERGEE